MLGIWHSQISRIQCHSQRFLNKKSCRFFRKSFGVVCFSSIRTWRWQADHRRLLSNFLKRWCRLYLGRIIPDRFIYISTLVWRSIRIHCTFPGWYIGRTQCNGTKNEKKRGSSPLSLKLSYAKCHLLWCCTNKCLEKCTHEHFRTSGRNVLQHGLRFQGFCRCHLLPDCICRLYRCKILQSLRNDHWLGR